MIHHQALADHITQASTELFRKMFETEVVAGEPRHEQIKGRTESGVAAVVAISGRYIGTGTLVCSSAAAVRLARCFADKPFEGVDDDVLDAVAEIANMIVGNIKNLLDEKMGPLYLGTPTVIHGKGFSTRSFSPAGWTVVPFELGDVRFDVQATLSINTTANSEQRRQRSVVLGVQR